MFINANFSTEQQLKQNLDFIYQKSKEGNVFHGLLEVAFNEVTIVTSIHNVKANKGAATAGLDKKNIDYYLQMPKPKLIALIQSSITDYKPKPVKRVYIPKANGKTRPLGIPTLLDRIIQECLRIVLDPIVEAKFYHHSYGFRPARACKHAVSFICNCINKNKVDIPSVAIEGDIKGFFDNVNHRILLNKLYKIGVHDKRVIAIIKKMLMAGYFEDREVKETVLGTPQGGILSPLLANVYLHDFDMTVARTYFEPTPRKAKDFCGARARLKKQGRIPKYLVRYADDWVILTTTEQEAHRLLEYLKRYFRYRLKLELSEEKTVITDMREKPIKFLGFLIKAEHRRRTPGKQADAIVGKPYPNPEKVKKQVTVICKILHAIYNSRNIVNRAALIEQANAKIVGIAEYWRVSICSKAFGYIDNTIDKAAFKVLKKTYPDSYMSCKKRICELSNRPHRHSKHKDTTWAIEVDGLWTGVTKAYITHSKWEKFPFHQKKTPYTAEGRMLIQKDRQKADPIDRPALYDVQELRMCQYRKDFYNFEYYMNREYAYNRDKGKCRICGQPLTESNRHCHHIDPTLPLNLVNKVGNLMWVDISCHMQIHCESPLTEFPRKMADKIRKYRAKLKVVI